MSKFTSVTSSLKSSSTNITPSNHFDSLTSNKKPSGLTQIKETKLKSDKPISSNNASESYSKTENKVAKRGTSASTSSVNIEGITSSDSKKDNNGSRNRLKNLNRELEKLIFRLENLANRLEKVPSNALKNIIVYNDVQKTATTTQNVQNSSNIVENYQSTVLDGPLKDLINYSSQIGGEVNEIALKVNQQFKLHKRLISEIIISSKPEIDVYHKAIRPFVMMTYKTQNLIENMKNYDYYLHLVALVMILDLFEWVIEVKPGQFFDNMIDASKLNTNIAFNKVREKEENSNKLHTKWMNSLIETVKSMKNFVAQNFPTDIIWLANGKVLDVNIFKEYETNDTLPKCEQILPPKGSERKFKFKDPLTPKLTLKNPDANQKDKKGDINQDIKSIGFDIQKILRKTTKTDSEEDFKTESFKKPPSELNNFKKPQETTQVKTSEIITKETKYVEDYTMLDESLKKFMNYSSQIDNDVKELSVKISNLFKHQKRLLDEINPSLKPTDDVFSKALKPIMNEIKEIQKFDAKLNPDYKNHISAIKDAVAIFEWVKRTNPGSYIQDIIDLTKIYTRRVIRKFKDDPATEFHVNWANSLSEILIELQNFVKKNYPTGLNIDGRNFFIVNLYQDDFKIEKCIPLTSKPMIGDNIAKKEKHPRFESIDRKWFVEHQIGKKVFVIDSTEFNQSVFIYSCKDSVIHIRGNVYLILVDSCERVTVSFENVLSAIELVNCKNTQIQVIHKVPTISIYKSEMCQIYLSIHAVDTEILTSKCSLINVLVPDEINGCKELTIPQQYKSLFENNKLVTVPSDVI